MQTLYSNSGKYKGRQIPLVLGLLFMAAAIVIFMEAKSFALMVVARILQALLTDSVSEERAGVVIGYAMIGFSVGQAIGPPVGAFPFLSLRILSEHPELVQRGTLYARYGYRAPFIFSLVLVGVDLAMRLILIEKHQALAWIRAGVGIPNFEAPGYVDPMSLPDPTAEPDNTISGKPAPIPLAGNARLDEEAVGEAPETAVKEEESKVPSHWRGLWYMIKDPRALTSFALTFLNGFILGGLLDTSPHDAAPQQRLRLVEFRSGLGLHRRGRPDVHRAQARLFPAGYGFPCEVFSSYHLTFPRAQGRRQVRHEMDHVRRRRTLCPGLSSSHHPRPARALHLLPRHRRSRHLVLPHARHGRSQPRSSRHARFDHSTRLWRVQPGLLHRVLHWFVSLTLAPPIRH
ncbi:SPOSA6832_02198, partial [Sporobolomyces salmonicolor]